ncbi:hypothetical protein AB1Y20_013445 [Prymnesium parvum]|uniref:Uncharacterized protein n=1 Tax=Prymnesium parvum TaxID=97485 RepID=A0AB34IFG7_PRYPA
MSGFAFLRALRPRVRLCAAPHAAAAAAALAGVSFCAAPPSRDPNFDSRFVPQAIAPSPPAAAPAAPATAVGASSRGEISTHVISKLGKESVDGAAVRVSFHSDLHASVHSAGWVLVGERHLSANGGVDDLVPVGALQRGLYLLEFDFGGVDAAARQLFRKTGDGKYVSLNPTGFFLAPQCAVTVKVEDANSLNHLVLSVGDKELTVRPGVRAH